jgi:hypothetical protein
MATYALLFFAPLVIAAFQSDFWSTPAALGALVIAVSLLAGLIRRKRLAWWLLLAFQLVVTASFAFAFTTVSALALNVAALAILVSSPMRRYLAQGDG